MTDEELAVIDGRSARDYHLGDAGEIHAHDAIADVATLLDFIDELRMKLSLCSEEYDRTREALHLCIQQRDGARADLAHARYLANSYAEAVWGTVGYTAPGSPASDGWVPGMPVPL